MRDHKDMFAPYLLPEDESEDPEAYYERYCTRLETTAEWGGHTETVAIAGALRRMIKVRWMDV
jgi:OTU domain-containing protein 6